MNDKKKKILLVGMCLALAVYVLLFFGGGLKNEIAAVKAYDSQNEKPTYFVYFSGIGCPHCAKTSPVLLKYKVRHSNIMVFEYEIYQSRINAPIIAKYAKAYDSGMSVPMLIINKDNIIDGAKPILVSLNEIIDKHQGNNILLPNANVSLEELNLADMSGLPRIWYKDRIAIREHESQASEEIKAFLIEGEVPKNAISIKPKTVKISGDEVEFKNAHQFNGWLLMWN